MEVKTLISIICLSLLSILINTKSIESNTIVTLKVFSGTENPSWKLSRPQVKKLEHLLLTNTKTFKPNYVSLGYQGFEVTSIQIGDISATKTVIGAPEAERFLLFTNPYINFGIVQYILHQIKIGYQDKADVESICGIESQRCGNNFNTKDFGPCCFGNYCDCDVAKQICTCQKESDVKITNTDCDKVPIVGPDSNPNYDPKTDDYGCFITKQYDNNCYNYGSDILTNTFAQPGRGTGQKRKKNTCADVQRAAISDGLTWVSTEIPTELPAVGHYVALMIWPNSNFHWIRLDDNMYWSHKPGGTAVKNTDNNGKVITDPSKQDFSPWTQYCGIFLVTPSKTTIN